MPGVLTLQAVQGMPIHTNLADAAFVLFQLPPHPTLRSMWEDCNSSRGLLLALSVWHSWKQRQHVCGGKVGCEARPQVIVPTPDYSSTTPHPCMSSPSRPAAADRLEK